MNTEEHKQKKKSKQAYYDPTHNINHVIPAQRRALQLMSVMSMGKNMSSESLTIACWWTERVSNPANNE